jgi:4-aminobutyrate aminotransferase
MKNIVRKSRNDTNSTEWIKREQECLAPAIRKHIDLVVSEAKGIELKNIDGKTYLDFTGGAQVCSVGYSHPEIIKATKQQIDVLDFVAIYNGIYPLRIQLAEKLKEIAPLSLKDGKVAYCNDGSEATEFSIKLARYNTKRPVLLTCMGAYHGGTMGALSLTVDSSDLRRNYSPFLPGVVTIPYASCYRCIFGQEYPKCALVCINYIEYIFKTVVKPEEVAAVFVEPIQAHGGVIIPPAEYFSKLRKICSEHGILIIDDEVVTGFGRTGKMFGIEHFTIEPDVMYFGKPIASGMPLGAILATRDLMENWESSGPASTLAANPLACARALAMIDLISKEELIENTNRVGESILRRIQEMAEIHPLIGDVRGKGLLIGIELVKNHITKEPAQDEAKHVMNNAYKRGLLISTSGIYKNVLKLSPPLILTQEQADAGLNILDNSLKEVAQSLK